MIYLDNAATTYPKPPIVYRVWRNAVSAYGANPGRSGHRFSADTAQAVYSVREKCAELFGAEPENVVFTLNCTHALNMVLKGLVKQHRSVCFITTDMEHNAVMRPLHRLKELHENITLTPFEVTEDKEQTLWNAQRAVTKASAELVVMVCTAASNVTGLMPPIKELGALCRRWGVCFVVDGAQGAGVIPLRMEWGINFLCCAGHKGLYGPMGTGLMITDGSFQPDTLIEGGTGSASASMSQPDYTPDRFESGTINTAGVIALGAGVDFLQNRGIDSVRRHELMLCSQFSRAIGERSDITLLQPMEAHSTGRYAPVVGFNIGGVDSAQVAELLSDRGIYMRGGLHCAPMAHRKFGTEEHGAVRFAPSVFTSPREVAYAAAVVRELAEKY